MADKYFIFGAAFNGDGTASNEAASAGAAGAWSQDSILTGTLPTYGSITAGDTVYIRSKAGNGANADITQTLVANITLGNANGTAALPITWILDDGTIWSGHNGTLTYTYAAGSFNLTTRANNRFIARTRHRWVIENTSVSPTLNTAVLTGESDGLLVSAPNRTNTGASGGVQIASSALQRNLKIATLRVATGTTQFLNAASNTLARIINLEIEIGSNANAGVCIGNTGSANSRFWIRGGRIYGAGATTGVSAFATPNAGGYAGIIDSVGLQIPKTMTFGASAAFNVTSAFGLDGGSGGAISEAVYSADSRNITNFYPVLNATLPDSGGSGVSWKLYPHSVTKFAAAALTFAKLYTQTAAAKKITLEMLIANPWTGAAVNRNSVWIDVCYINNATGEPVTESTRLESGALTGSTAGWNVTNYGSVLFDKYKLELTTANSIKQDTAVTVVLSVTCASASADDLFMVCPDPQLTTP